MQKVCLRKLHWRKCWGGKLLRNVSQLDKNYCSLATRWRWHWKVQIFLFPTFHWHDNSPFPQKTSQLTVFTQTHDGFHHAAVVSPGLAPGSSGLMAPPLLAAFWRDLDKCRDQCCIINVNVSHRKQTYHRAQCLFHAYWSNKSSCHFPLPSKIINKFDQ